MQKLQNNRFLRALAYQPVDRTPIWIMRQAGRYLPEYRATREKAGSFLTLCKTPALACEVTLQPIRRFDLDAAIIFSDILTIPDAMGLSLEMVESIGPVFAYPIQTATAISQLKLPPPGSLQYVYDAIKLVQQELAGKVPLIGFCGSPWTLAAYMIEGRGKTGFPLLKKMQQAEPSLLHQLLDILAKAVLTHLHNQISAGVQAVMIFDTWGGILSPTDYPIFSLSYMQQIINGLKQIYPSIPIILFTKGGARFLPILSTSGCDAVGLDWEISLAKAKSIVNHRVALQGNMNPATLKEKPAVIRQAVAQILQAYGSGSGHVFNLGHGITPDIPPDHVTVLIEAVHELSQPYHLK